MKTSGIFIWLFLLISGIFQTICFSVYGQFPSLSFNNITMVQGLSRDDVRYMYQDKDGFMWFGCLHGADRYDGQEFREYYNLIRDPTQGYVQSIIGIEEDDNKGIWFIDDTCGIVLMNKANGKTLRFRHHSSNPASISSNKARSILFDSGSNLWITTEDKGLNLFNPEDSSFIHFQHNPDDSSSIGSNTLASIVEDRNGILWISSTDGLLIRFDPDSKEFTNIRMMQPPDIYWNRTISPFLYVDSHNKVWYTQSLNIFRYDPESGYVQDLSLKSQEADVSRYRVITSLLELNESTFIITTHNDGLYLLNPENGRTVQYTYNPGNSLSICSNHLSGSYRSRDSVVWISSFDNGISTFSKSTLRFTKIMNLVPPEDLVYSSYPVYSIHELQGGKLIAGTENNGLITFDPATNHVERFLPQLGNTTVYDLYEHEGKIWLSTWLNGLYTYDIKSKTLQRIYSIQGMTPSDTFRKVVRTVIDRKNRVWIGSMTSGLRMFDQKNHKQYWFTYKEQDQNTLWDNMIFKIFEDNDGLIWIGTGNGLNLYDEKSGLMKRIILQDEHKRNLVSLKITDIAEDSQKQLWFGSDRTLFMKQAGSNTFENLPFISNGMTLTVNKIQIDKKNIIWMNSVEGIASYNSTTHKFKSYGMSDGIQHLSGIVNAGTISKGGLIYFGTTKGLVCFSPSNITEDTLVPPVVITKILVNNVPYELDTLNSGYQKLHLKTWQGSLNYLQLSLEFRFAALHYVNPQGNQFEYMLKGYDQTWINNGNQNKVLYRDIPPGRYIFMVRASNSHGYWNTKGTSIEIQITGPFWKTLAFKIVASLLAVIIISLLYYIRLNQLKRKRDILEETVKDRTHELNEANVQLKDQHFKLLQQHEEISVQNEHLSLLSAKIIKQNEELENHQLNLENLVAKRTAELEIALRKAEESDKLKSAFLANMSHEIRTPMNAIVGFANLLKERDLNFQERNEFIEIINTNSESLLVLIDDILDLSLIEANQLHIREEDFSLNEALDHVYSSYSLMNRNRDLNIRLNNQLHEMNIMIHSDRVRFNQIIANLMSNACKFTSTGYVELGAERKDNDLVIYVKDSGIGIKPEELEAIFERFRKSDEQLDTLYRGTGLGLTICKALTELLKGEISVESEISKGSTFYLKLPWSKVSFRVESQKSYTSEKETASDGTKEILIVEDEIANYLYVRKMLTRMKVNVQWAENGIEAIKLAASGNKFDVILMDIKMPVMDGFEATKTIKKANPDQVVIALTAYARPEDRLHFMDAGFDDYLSKPIKPEEFIKVMNRYL